MLVLRHQACRAKPDGTGRAPNTQAARKAGQPVARRLVVWGGWATCLAATRPPALVNYDICMSTPRNRRVPPERAVLNPQDWCSRCKAPLERSEMVSIKASPRCTRCMAYDIEYEKRLLNGEVPRKTRKDTTVPRQLAQREPTLDDVLKQAFRRPKPNK